MFKKAELTDDPSDWEEMEIVEGADTPDERSDTFWRLGPYGVAESGGAFQAYIVAGGRPFMVADGFETFADAVAHLKGEMRGKKLAVSETESFEKAAHSLLEAKSIARHVFDALNPDPKLKTALNSYLNACTDVGSLDFAVSLARDDKINLTANARAATILNECYIPMVNNRPSLDKPNVDLDGYFGETGSKDDVLPVQMIEKQNAIVDMIDRLDASNWLKKRAMHRVNRIKDYAVGLDAYDHVLNRIRRDLEWQNGPDNTAYTHRMHNDDSLRGLENDFVESERRARYNRIFENDTILDKEDSDYLHDTWRKKIIDGFYPLALDRSMENDLRHLVNRIKFNTEGESAEKIDKLYSDAYDIIYDNSTPEEDRTRDLFKFLTRREDRSGYSIDNPIIFEYKDWDKFVANKPPPSPTEVQSYMSAKVGRLHGVPKELREDALALVERMTDGQEDRPETTVRKEFEDAQKILDSDMDNDAKLSRLCVLLWDRERRRGLESGFEPMYNGGVYVGRPVPDEEPSHDDWEWYLVNRIALLDAPDLLRNDVRSLVDRAKYSTAKMKQGDVAKLYRELDGMFDAEEEDVLKLGRMYRTLVNVENKQKYPYSRRLTYDNYDWLMDRIRQEKSRREEKPKPEPPIPDEDGDVGGEDEGGSDGAEPPAPLPISIGDVDRVKRDAEMKKGPGVFDKRYKAIKAILKKAETDDEMRSKLIAMYEAFGGDSKKESSIPNTVNSMIALDDLKMEDIVGCEEAVAGKDGRKRLFDLSEEIWKYNHNTDEESKKKQKAQLDGIRSKIQFEGQTAIEQRRKKKERQEKKRTDEKALSAAYEALRDLLAPYERAKQNANPENKPSERMVKEYEQARETLLYELMNSPDFKTVSDQAVAILKKDLEQYENSGSALSKVDEMNRDMDREAIDKILIGNASIEVLEAMSGAVDEEDVLPLLKLLNMPSRRDNKGRRLFDVAYDDMSRRHGIKVREEQNKEKERLKEEEKKRKEEEKRRAKEKSERDRDQLMFDELYSKAYHFLFDPFDDLTVDEWNDPENQAEYDRLQEAMRNGLAGRLDKTDALYEILNKEYDDGVELYDAILNLCFDEGGDEGDEGSDGEGDEGSGDGKPPIDYDKVEAAVDEAVDGNLGFAAKTFSVEEMDLFKNVLMSQVLRRAAIYGNGSLNRKYIDGIAYDIVMRVNRAWNSIEQEPLTTLTSIGEVPDRAVESQLLGEKYRNKRDATLPRTRPWDRFLISSFWSRPFYYTKIPKDQEKRLLNNPNAQVKVIRSGPSEYENAQRVGPVPYVLWRMADKDGNVGYTVKDRHSKEEKYKSLNIYDPELKPDDLHEAVESLTRQKYDRGNIDYSGTAGKSWNDYMWLVYYARHGLLSSDLQPANQAEFEKMLIGERPYLTKTGAKKYKDYSRIATEARLKGEKIEPFEDWVYNPENQKRYGFQASHVLRLPFIPGDLTDPMEVPQWMNSYGNSYKFQNAGIGHLAEYERNFGHVVNPRTGRSFVSRKEWAEHARYGYDLTERERRGNLISSGSNTPIGTNLGIYGNEARDPYSRKLNRKERIYHSRNFEERFGHDLKFMPRTLKYGDMEDMETYMKMLDDAWDHDYGLFMRWMAEMNDRRNNGRADEIEDPITWSQHQTYWQDFGTPKKEGGRTFKNLMYTPSMVINMYKDQIEQDVRNEIESDAGGKFNLREFNKEVNRRLANVFGADVLQADPDGIENMTYTPNPESWMNSERFEKQYGTIVKALEEKGLMEFKQGDKEGFMVFVPRPTENGYKMRWSSRKGDPESKNYDENYAKLYSDAMNFSKRMSSYADMMAKYKRGEGMHGAPSPQTIAEELEKQKYRQENRRRLEAGARRGRRLTGAGRWDDVATPGMKNYADALTSRFGVDFDDLLANGYLMQSDIYNLANTKQPWDTRIRPVVLAVLLSEEDRASNYLDWADSKQSNNTIQAMMEADPEERGHMLDTLLDLAKKDNPDMTDEIDALTLRDENGGIFISNAPFLAYLRSPDSTRANRMRLIDYMKSDRERRKEMMDAAGDDETMKEHFKNVSATDLPSELMLARALKSGRIDKKGYENLSELPPEAYIDALQKEGGFDLASKGRGWNSNPYDENYGADKGDYAKRNAERSAKFIDDIYSQAKEESDAHPLRKIDPNKRFYDVLERNVSPIKFNGSTVFVNKPYDTFISQPLSERMKDIAAAYDPEDPGLFNRYSQAADEYTGPDEYEPFASYMGERGLGVPDFNDSWNDMHEYDIKSEMREKYKPPQTTYAKSYGRRLATTKVWNIMNEMFKDRRQTVADEPAYMEPVVKSVDDAWREAAASRGYKIDRHDTSVRDDDSEDSFASIYKRANEKADSERGRPVTYTSEVEMNATWGRGPRPVKETYRHVDYDDRNSPMPADITVIHSGDGNMTPKRA